MKEGPTVEAVARSYLCCTCGACVAVCPEKAVSMGETDGGYLFPRIDADLCTECGECRLTCAGTGLNAGLPEDPFEGECLGCWVGRAAQDDVYERSQSGGVATALLLSLLEAGSIHGAATAVMEPGTPPRPEARWSRSRAEILAAQGSKYGPVPVLSVLRDLEGEPGPVAVVGLGCHVHGLRNLMQRQPEWQARIDPVIGLICDRTMSLGALDYLLWNAGVRGGERSLLEYRSKRWRGFPGDVRISGDSGKEVFLPGRERRQIKDCFTPARCRLCFDKMNVLSDVTVGDPWGLDGYDRKGGASVLIARTGTGLEAVRSAVDAGHLELREIPYSEVLLGQNIPEKRDEFAAYCREWRRRGWTLPGQAEAVLETSPARRREEGGRFAVHIDRALDLDRFGSRRALFKDVRKQLRRRRLARKLRGLLRPFSSAAAFFRGKGS